MNALRELLPKKAKGRPPRAPLRKKRFVGRAERERSVFHRQRLPQAEPMEVERTAVRVSMRLARVWKEAKGLVVKDLYLRMEMASMTVVMKRAMRGTERRMWCRNAVLQLGAAGCRSAHERLEMEGCAGPVIGAMDLIAAGRVLGLDGCRIGEVKGLEA